MIYSCFQKTNNLKHKIPVIIKLKTSIRTYNYLNINDM